MSVTKELIEQEAELVQTGHFRDVHFHKEGTFLRAYCWSAWLCCRYPFRRICNPTESNISICNAPLFPFPRSAGLQIPTN